MKYIYPLVLLILGLAFIGGWVYINSREHPVKTSAELGIKPVEIHLSVDDVLGWRNTYADLLGKSKDAVIERYGRPPNESEPTTLEYPPSEKTDFREIHFALLSDRVFLIKIFAKNSDIFDVRETIKKARLFNFSAGTFDDSTIEYFSVRTLDYRTTLQWNVSDKGIKFYAVMFTSHAPEAPARPRPKRR